MLQPGDKLDHYVVEAHVGGGGMASIYRVRHHILGHTMALKVLAPRWVQKESVRRRFLAEGRIMALVRHPAIVMVTDAVVDPARGVAGLVMEYVEGPDLQQIIHRLKGPPDVDLVRAILMPVLAGMHHMHQEGVVHRDLKPSNVLLSRDAAGGWHPRVTDFGVAHLTEKASISRIGRRTREGGLVGTPAYMCPEQIRTRTRPTAQWDVFALGVVTYELATGGLHPFERGDEDATMSAIERGEFVPVHEVHPGIDRSVRLAIEGALQVDPAKRHESCAAFAEVLGAISPTPAVAEEQAPDATEARLELPSGRGGASSWPMPSRDVVVGSGPKEGLRIPLSGIEPEHCRLRYSNRHWVLHNLSSSGTHVNGARVHTIELGDGDLVRMGSVVMRFLLGPAPRAAAIAPRPPVSLPIPSSQDGPWLQVPLAAGLVRVPIGLDDVIIGRSPACDVVLDDPTVSVRHARLLLQGTDLLIEDLHSANGTRVNGQKARFRRLRHGDEVSVGSVSLRVFLR